MSRDQLRRARAISRSRRVWMVLGLLSLSGVLLYLHEKTQWDLLSNLATVPIEMVIGAILIEGYVARKEQEKRARQLMLIKSCIFRSELRELYLANFAGLAEPPITMSMIRRGGLSRLRELRESAANVRYRSPEAMEHIIMEYVRAYPVFYGFMEWAIANDSDAILSEMVFVLHLIQDVRVFKANHPDRMFAEYAEEYPEVMAKVMRMLGTGIVKFIDYAIELKNNQPTTFDDLLADYEMAASVPEGALPRLGEIDKGRSVFHALIGR